MSAELSTADERIRELYEHHSAYLLGYLTRMLRDPQQAEDIVQETLLRAWRHLERMTEDHGSVRGWLLRVAHNIAVDWVRARKARPLEVDAELGSYQPARVEDPAEELLRELDILRMLRGIPPEQGYVVYEIYVTGRTAAEVAARLGVPVGTVKSRAFYGLRALRVILAR